MGANGSDDRQAEPPQPPALIGRLVLVGRRVLMAGFALVWLGGVGTMAAWVGAGMYGELRKGFVYRRAPAEVVSYTPASRPADEDEDEGEESPARIEYSYVVAGRTYRGESAPSAQFPNEFEAALPRSPAPGMKITAYYDPDDAGQSTLIPIAQPGESRVRTNLWTTGGPGRLCIQHSF